MDQAGGVRDVEARTDVLDERYRALGLECTLATQQRAQVLAVYPLHRDVEEPVVFAGVEHRDDARDAPATSAIWLSRRKRSRNRESAASVGSSTLSATASPSASRARWTAPVALSRSSDSIR